jgi:hypothetical protein
MSLKFGNLGRAARFTSGVYPCQPPDHLKLKWDPINITVNSQLVLMRFSLFHFPRRIFSRRVGICCFIRDLTHREFNSRL